MAGNSTAADPTLPQEEAQQTAEANPGNNHCEDIFLTLQNATKIVTLVCNDFFALPKAEFIQHLFDQGGISELMYVRDMIFSIVKRRHNIPNAEILINRIHEDSVKDKLVKDIYTLYSFGEGNSKTLPKSLLKAPEVAQKSAQTDIESEQTSLLKSLVQKTYATKYELKSLRDNLTLEISKLKEDIMLTPEGMLHSQSLPDPVSPSLAVPSSSRPSTLHSIPEYSVSVPNRNTTESNTLSVEHGNTKHNILVAGDSLLHRLDANKMCVEQIKVKKLTKPGDTLNGTFSRIKDYASKHSNVQLEVVVLAGTNDLNRRNVTPQSLIDQLVDHIAVFKEFCNVKNIFVCKITPRCDRHVTNSKVSEYN